MKKPKPPCETVLPWLRANLGKDCLTPLTGTDARALKAAVMIIDVYSCADLDTQSGLLDAFRSVVLCMQPHTRELAYHAIAHVMDWGHRADLWRASGLMAQQDGHQPRFRCAYEPK